MDKTIRKIENIWWKIKGYFQCLVLQEHIVGNCKVKNGRNVYYCDCGRVIMLPSDGEFIAIDTKKKEVMLESEKEELEIEVK